MVAQAVQPTLPQLLKTQEHADFIIRTETRDFHVHKCIISTRSAFFRGASRGDFKAHNGIVEVEERTEVIEALLELIYEAPLSFVPCRLQDSRDTLEKKCSLENLLLATDLQLAADKYLVAVYDEDLSLTIVHCVNDDYYADTDDTLLSIVQMAVQISRKELQIEFVPRLWVILTLAKSLARLMAVPAAWPLLLEHGALLKAITGVVLVYHEFILPPPRLSAQGEEWYWSRVIGATCQLAEVDATDEKYSIKTVLAEIEVFCTKLSIVSPGDI